MGQISSLFFWKFRQLGVKPISCPISLNNTKKHLRTWSKELHIELNPLRMLIRKSLYLAHSRLGTEVSLLILLKAHHYNYTLYLWYIFYILQILKNYLQFILENCSFRRWSYLQSWQKGNRGEWGGPLDFWCINSLLKSPNFSAFINTLTGSIFTLT